MHYAGINNHDKYLIFLIIDEQFSIQLMQVYIIFRLSSYVEVYSYNTIYLSISELFGRIDDIYII